jgi:putative DNA primase/helicase
MKTETKIDSKLMSQEEQKFLNTEKSNQEIFQHILKNTAEADFDNKAEGKKITRKEIIVITVDELLDVAEKLELGLCFHQSYCYLYNGCYWSKSYETEIKNFLGDYAKKLGLGHLYANYFRFKEDLYKQFASSASNINFLKKERNTILLNLRNGTLEVNNGKFNLREFRKADFLTYQLKFDYDQEATSPIFNKFLDEVLPDKELQQIISEYFGSIFIPDELSKVEKALFLYGSGQNGKSVIFEVIEALFGKENLSSYSLNTLTSSEKARYNIQDKIINFSSEVGEIVNVDAFKKIVSREPIDARCLYKDLIIIRNYAKMVFNCNKLPRNTEITKGFFRRFLIIPFDVIIKDEDVDKNLSQKIISSELPGVLNWIIGGLERFLKQDGFTPSKKCDEIQLKFEKESNNVALFIDEENKVKAHNEYIQVTEIYNHYRNYCFENGFKPGSRRTFVERLENMGFEKSRKAIGVVFNIKTK